MRVTDPAADQPARRVAIRGDPDVAVARRHVRELGRRLGWPPAAVEALATAVSEVAWNIVVHADVGEMRFDGVRDRDRVGVEVVALDRGPGIADLDRAMQDGYSTAGGLGLGLPSARRLVDEFELAGGAGGGTVVIMRKWSR